MDFQTHSQPQGEYGRFEQILTQFLLKSLHIILDSRVPSLRPCSRGGEVKKSDKWFNLVLGDRPATLDNLHFWHRNLMEPMVIDIILAQDRPGSTSGMLEETVLERWVVQYEHIKTMAPLTGDGHYKKTYQKSIILLRSLYTILRFLPANKAFQKLLSLSQTCDFDINYKVSSFSAPFSRAEEGLMKPYSLTPVDAQQGRLTISVMYRENLSDFNLETSASFPPEIITDYVGSPLTDPLRAFHTIDKGGRAASFSSRGMQPSSSSPFERPRSWTSGIHRPQNQHLSGSPPLYYAPHSSSSSPSDIYGNKIQSYNFSTHHKSTSPDSYQLSPPFSPSPSPSPPTYLSGGNPVQNRWHSESSPVSIPYTMMGRSPRYLSPNFSDPNRHSLPPLSPRSTRYNTSSQESSSGMRSLRKSESLKAGESNSRIINPGQEMSRDAKDDSGRFSADFSSGSPRVGSRSSGRLSFHDDMDDMFTYPFIVDDVPDFHVSHNLGVKKGSELSLQGSSSTKKSQDTAVAALVHLLRTAPPLRQDASSSYSSQAGKSKLEGGEAAAAAASGFFLPRKTSDALEELRSYSELKDLLLSKSAAREANKDKT